MNRYIPALRFRFLTRFFDALLPLVLPEDRFRSALLDQAGLESGARVLDLGCGTGTLLLGIGARAPDAALYGIDLDREALDMASRKSRAGPVRMLLCRGSVARLPFADGSFDRVLSSLVFHHLTRDVKHHALREALRVLRPGGELHVGDWGRPSSLLMRAAFLSVRLLDGFATTRDSVKEVLPALMRETGFEAVMETGRVDSMVGTLRLYRGRKTSRPRTEIGGEA